MPYIVIPPQLSDITSEGSFFFDAVSAMDSFLAEPATELFGAESLKKQGFDASKLPDKLEAASTAILAKAVDDLRTALYNWDHTLSKQMNDCVSQLFATNKDRVKLLSADLSKFTTAAKKLEKDMKDKGLTDDVKESLRTQYEEACDRIEEIRETIKSLKTSIRLTPEFYHQLQVATDQAKTGLKTLADLFNKYNDTIKAKEDPKNARYPLKDAHAVKELSSFREDLYSGKTASILSGCTDTIQQITNRYIYGVKIDPMDPTATISYDIAQINQVSKTYQQYKKISDNIQHRIALIKRALQSSDKMEYKSATRAIIVQEIPFLSAPSAWPTAI